MIGTRRAAVIRANETAELNSRRGMSLLSASAMAEVISPSEPSPASTALARAPSVSSFAVNAGAEVYGTHS